MRILIKCLASLVFLFSITVLMPCISAEGVAGDVQKNISEVDSEISGVTLAIESPPGKTEYLTFETFDFSGLVIKATHSDGRVENIGGDKLSYSYRQADSFRFGDNCVVGEYEGAKIEIPVTVGKRSYDISGVVFKDKTVSFCGEETSIFQEGIMPVGLDGIPLSYEVMGSGRDVGVYPVVLVFKTESREYEIPRSIERTLTVIPCECEIIWDKLSFVYDGTLKTPRGYYVDVDGRIISAVTVGGGVNAGVYTVLAIPTDSNYRFLGASVDFTVERAVYDMSGVRWSEADFVYDGEDKEIVVSGLPLGVSVLEYVGNIGNSAGKYTAVASLSYDSDNYEDPGELSIVWEIKKADIDLSLVAWSDGEYYYDGGDKYIELINLPPEITLMGYENNYRVGAGVYEVVPIISYDVQNYNPPIIGSGWLVIRKCVVALPTLAPAIYTGQGITPEISESDLYRSLFETHVDAGSYYVTLELYDKDNYEFFDGGAIASIKYEILPRVISVTVSDVESYLFEREPLPSYEITDGEISRGDSLSVSYYRADGKIYCLSENPNYVLLVTPGSIINHNTPSVRGYFFIFFLAVAFICFVLLLIILILNRRRIIYVSSDSMATGESRRSDSSFTQAKTKEEYCEQKPEFLSVTGGKASDEKMSEDGEERVNAISEERADSLISDALAKDLLYKNGSAIYTGGNARGIINVDTLSQSFLAGDRVDVNILKEKNLVPYDTKYIKVLARGVIDKPLTVYANDFSLAAVKMIALAGGASIKVTTFPRIKTKINRKSIEKEK